MNKIYQAIVQGYQLSLQRIDLLIITLAFIGSSYAFEYWLSATNQNLFVKLLSALIAFISISYNLSIPYFFSTKEKEYTNLVSVTLQNAKRLILPTLVFFALLFVIIMGAISMMSAMEVDLRAFPTSLTQSLANLATVFHPSAVIFRLFVALFTFTPIYFSVKHKPILESLKMSFSFAYQHRGIVLVFFLFQSLYIATTLPTWSQPAFMVIQGLLQVYASYLVTACAYSYFIASSKG